MERVEYTPPDPEWESKEALLLAELERRDRLRALRGSTDGGLEPEPPGIDAFLLVPPPPSALGLIGDKRVPIAAGNAKQVS